MKPSSIANPAHSPDTVFLALGQTVYAGQLFEFTMLEVLAAARELLDGTGDGTTFHDSIESLSRRTLGQLLAAFRERADIRSDIESLLCVGLEARNFVVHRFAQYVGDDLDDESTRIQHQRMLYEKCAEIMAANDSALAMLEAIGKSQARRSVERVAELEQTATALRELVASLPKPTH